MTAAAVGGLPERMSWLQALKRPEVVQDWTLPEWERVIRLTRRMRLLARLAERLASAGVMDRVPVQVRRHLVAEQRLSRWRSGAMRWTLERVAAMLGDAPYPRVLLKGAAYMGQDLPIAAGRLPSDLDILVPRDHVSDAQERLTRAGWEAVNLDEHDRRFYFEWSHEVPPMRHPLLQMELDLHHNILPPMSSVSVNAAALLERLHPSKWATWQVLDPVDQVLHSAAHLFRDSEMRDRIRDLVDLDGLLRHFGATPGFMAGLPERARELGLEEPLALACHFCSRWLATPIPDDVLGAVEAIGPGRVRRAWMLPLFSAALMPTEADDTRPLRQNVATVLLLARYHRQRLPMHLLLPHLWHKLWVSRQPPGGKDLNHPAGS